MSLDSQPPSGRDDSHTIDLLAIARRVVGPKAAAALQGELGGLRIYVPTKPAAHSPISLCIGAAGARAIAEEAGGTWVYVPIGKNCTTRRRALVLQLRLEGVKTDKIARRLRKCVRTIDRDLQKLRADGFALPRPNHRSRKPEA